MLLRQTNTKNPFVLNFKFFMIQPALATRLLSYCVNHAHCHNLLAQHFSVLFLSMKTWLQPKNSLSV